MKTRCYALVVASFFIFGNPLTAQSVSQPPLPTPVGQSSPKGKGSGPQAKGNVGNLKVNQPAAPAGFDTPRSGVSRGKVEFFDMASKSDGGTYRVSVYTPPGYSGDKTYPVLYLLHGKS